MDTPSDSQPTREQRARLSWVEWSCLAAAAAILIWFRHHAFELPLETDECNYAHIGARLLAGERLYVDVWDHQPFGVFALFAGVISIFGDAPEVFRWLAVAFSLGSLGLIHAIVRTCAGQPSAIAAALLFAVVSSDPGTAGEGCNREIFMNTFILAAWCLALRSEGRCGWLLLAAGASLAIGSSLKTVVAVHWLMLAFWITWVAWRASARDRRVRSLVKAIALLGLCPAILWLAALGYYALTDRLNEFIDAVFLFNVSYGSSSETIFHRFMLFFSPPRHPFTFDSAWPLWVGLIAAVGWMMFDAIRRGHRGAVAVLALVVGSYLAVCLPGRFWPHYYYLLVPPAVIAVAVMLGGVSELLSARAGSSRRVRMLASVLIHAVVPVGLVFTECEDYLSQPPFGITVDRYNSRDFWGRAQGENVGRVTDPGDEIFVYGNEAEIYYYSQRRCASRYTMITGLSSGMGGVDRRREIMMSELRERLPRVIVVLFDEEPFDEWKAFLDEHYGEPVGWDFHDKSRSAIMFVLAHRDRPIESINWDWDRSEVGGWFPIRKR